MYMCMYIHIFLHVHLYTCIYVCIYFFSYMCIYTHRTQVDGPFPTDKEPSDHILIAADLSV